MQPLKFIASRFAALSDGVLAYSTRRIVNSMKCLRSVAWKTTLIALSPAVHHECRPRSRLRILQG